MKKFSFLLVFAFILSFLNTSVYAEDISVSARAAVLILADSGEVLYEKSSHEKLPMASTTKIMTSLLALESGERKKNIRVTEEMVAVEGTSMGLKPDDTVSVENLVYGMLLQSGNDAANVTASVLSKGKSFSDMMNERAKEIGMTNTNFVTPSGLDSKDHYSCAYDMALLAAEALKNPEFRYICSKTNATVSYGNPPYLRTLYNHNRLLRECEGCIGVKTGFTKKSGRCLVSAAERNGSLLIAVTLNAPNDWNDHKRLYDYGFSRVQTKTLSYDLSDYKFSVVGGEKESVGVKLMNTPTVTVKDDNIEAKVFIEHFEYAPVKKGDTVGYVRYLYKDKIIEEVPIITTEAVKVRTV